MGHSRNPKMRSSCPHCTDEGTEAQRREVTCPESQASESGFHRWQLESRGHTSNSWQVWGSTILFPHQPVKMLLLAEPAQGHGNALAQTRRQPSTAGGWPLFLGCRPLCHIWVEEKSWCDASLLSDLRPVPSLLRSLHLAPGDPA